MLEDAQRPRRESGSTSSVSTSPGDHTTEGTLSKVALFCMATASTPHSSPGGFRVSDSRKLLAMCTLTLCVDAQTLSSALTGYIKCPALE